MKCIAGAQLSFYALMIWKKLSLVTVLLAAN